MPFKMPPEGHKVWDCLGSEATVLEILDRANMHRLPMFSDAVREARRTFLANPKLVTAVFIICMKADDTRALVRVGPRGGQRTLWTFGKGY